MASMPACTHIDSVREAHPHVTPHSTGCEECLKLGKDWVHLRMCLVCGHIGCCDSSPGKHATKHFHHMKHAVMQSVEPGENWRWCFVDEVEFEAF